MPDMRETPTRRQVLAATGAATAALAGCAQGDEGGNANGAGDGEPDGGVTGPNESRPAWQTTTLTDVTTDDSFAVADLNNPVVLHTFATWCSTCESQQNNIENLADRRDDITFVDVTIDPNDDADKVATHAENNGFGWRFGIAPSAMTDSLVDGFGSEIAVAPQSPVLVVCPDGATYRVGKIVSASTIETTVDSNCG